MEPMTLGSPTHSPSGSPNTSFLPPFLMGEFNQPTTPRTNSLSPTKGRSLAFGNNSPPIRPSPQQAPSYSTPLRQKATPNVSFSNKVNGPPTQGLFDTLQQPDWRQAPQSPQTSRYASPPHYSSFNQTQQDTSIYAQADSSLGPNSSQIYTQQSNLNQSYGFNQSNVQQTSILSNNASLCYNSPAADQVDNRFGEEANEIWVTVFGFPTSAASMVLTQFSNCGNIIDKKFPAQGNWVWIRFASRSEAGRALALSGRVLPGGLMVGALPCPHPPQNNKGAARHLTAGPTRLQNTSTTSTGANTSGAQRSTGTLSRALEYVFGW